jgi:site-specific DNA recombinase
VQVDACIYARLSQDKSGLSDNVEIQITECEDYALSEGLRVVAVFTDNDISASRYSRKPRPGYEQMLAFLKTGGAQVILVTEMTRLYRRLEELLEIIRLAETSSLRKIETTDGMGYDLSTGQGIHNAVSAVNNAALEARKISDRTRRKKKVVAMRGGYNGGPRPFGYCRDGVTPHEFPFCLRSEGTIVAGEAGIVRELAARLIAGQSLKTLTRFLNDNGIRTTQGHRWGPTTVRRVLESHRIAGLRQHNGKTYPASWPALVSQDDWDRMQLILRAERRYIGQQKRGREYLLTGLLECGVCGDTGAVCGKALYGMGTRGKRYYGCRGPVDHQEAHLIRLADPVDSLVSQAVLYRFDSLNMQEALTTAADPEIGTLLETYQRQKQRLTDLVTDYASGLLDREQLAHAKQVVEEAMAATNHKLTRLETGRAFASLPPNQTIRDAWQQADVTWRRGLLSLLVEKVVLLPSRPGGSRWTDPETGKMYGFDPTKVVIHWRV